MATDPANGTAAAKSDESAQSATAGRRLCKDCRHQRRWVRPTLFSSAELQTAGGLKALGEWEQQDKQHSEREMQLFGSGVAFMFEPHHYAWCAAYTPLADVKAANAGDEQAAATLVREGGASLNPVSGEWTPIYALCQRVNLKGDCEKHERR